MCAVLPLEREHVSSVAIREGGLEGVRRLGERWVWEGIYNVWCGR